MIVRIGRALWWLSIIISVLFVALLVIVLITNQSTLDDRIQFVGTAMFSLLIGRGARYILANE